MQLIGLAPELAMRVRLLVLTTDRPVQVHPDTGISSKAMSYVPSLLSICLPC
jgi:hypothetical protein